MADPRKIVSRVRSFGANLRVVGDDLEIVNSHKLPAEAAAVIRANSAAIASALREEAGEQEPPPAEPEPEPPAPLVFGATFFDMADLCWNEAVRRDHVKGQHWQAEHAAMKAAAQVLGLLSLDAARSAAFLAALAADHPVEAPLLANVLGVAA